jgi:transposase InsO family protein
MEAIPFSETFAVACAHDLLFSWITCFGVLKMITSDHGLQFTPIFWSQLCEMLYITYHQATAYHPESKGAVERLQHHLKDALRACTAMAT